MSQTLPIFWKTISFFKKKIFSNFQTRFPCIFSDVTWGHIYMNRILSTSSSALHSQKLKNFLKKWFWEHGTSYCNIESTLEVKTTLNFSVTSSWPLMVFWSQMTIRPNMKVEILFTYPRYYICRVWKSLPLREFFLCYVHPYPDTRLLVIY